MRLKRGEPLTLREDLPNTKIEVFGSGVRVVAGYHPGTPFVVSFVLSDEQTRDLTRWLSAQGFGARGRRRSRAPAAKQPVKKCYRGRVCGSVPCECSGE